MPILLFFPSSSLIAGILKRENLFRDVPLKSLVDSLAKRAVTSLWEVSSRRATMIRSLTRAFSSIGEGESSLSTARFTCSLTIRKRSCLLYTSDAADDLLCVDLGGRRIINK